MNIGTKSVLYGAHCFLIHPWFVALAWWQLYGFPVDPRLWIAFFVHDLGYIGKPNMDGPEGESHPELGAKIMGFLFGEYWMQFTLYHSRFYAKKHNMHPSMLCCADKLAGALTPRWWFLLSVNLTGEINEYMRLAIAARNGQGKYARDHHPIPKSDLTQQEWYDSMTSSMRKWAYDNKRES